MFCEELLTSMVTDYSDLIEHVGHTIECVVYSETQQHHPANVALECLTCDEVLLDFDREEE